MRTRSRRAPLQFRTVLFALLLIAGAFAWIDASADPPPSAEDSLTEGSLVTRGAGGVMVPMPLAHTEVQAEISGFLARVEVKQTFGNPFEAPIEAVYLFPLPDMAAVDDMRITIGARTIVGEIHRREEARRIYESARASGYAAALLEQERPNIFTQSVANIEPGHEITVVIRYVERLAYEAGVYTFNYPMVVGSRYTPAAAAAGPDDPEVTKCVEGEPQGLAVADPGPPSPGAGATVKDGAHRYNPHVLTPGFRSGHDITLSVAIDAGVPLHDLASPSHAIEVQREGATRALVQLGAHDRIPNKDFTLKIPVAGELPELGLLANRESGDGFFSLVLQPKAEVSAREAAPKEIIFVLDTSGSMSGPPMAMSQRFMLAALRNLGPRDRFNIVRFAGAADVLAPAPLANTAENVARAADVVRGTEGGGGTEMLAGFRAAFEQPHDEATIRIVLFLTDGYIGNESEILGAIQKSVGEARIFTLGIGSSVNHYLLGRMASLGRGSYQFIRADGREAEAVDRFYGWVTRPYITDLSIDWGALPVADLSPAALPDLYAGQTLSVVGRFLWGATDTVIVRGKLGGRPWQQQIAVTLPERSPRHAALASVWARHRIDALMMRQQTGPRPECEAEVVALALQYRLMSAYTSFVAVDDSTVVAPGGPAMSVPQAVPMPDQVSFVGIFGSEGPAGIKPFTRPALEAQTAAPEPTGVSPFHDEFISDLPILGRNYQNVLSLAPGVQDDEVAAEENGPAAGVAGIAAGTPGAPAALTAPSASAARTAPSASAALMALGYVGAGQPVAPPPAVVGGVMGGVPGGVLGGVAYGTGSGAAGSGMGEADFKATVDGISNVDPLTGTFMSNVEADAIEEAETIATGAEYPGAVGGFGVVLGPNADKSDLARRKEAMKQAKSAPAKSNGGDRAARDFAERRAARGLAERRLAGALADRRVVDAALRTLADLADDGHLSRSEGRPALAGILAAQRPGGALAEEVQAHAVATWTLAEALASRGGDLSLTERDWVEAALMRALEHLAATRTAGGAWPDAPGGVADRTGTAWAAIAIAAAREAGVSELPSMPEPRLFLTFGSNAPSGAEASEVRALRSADRALAALLALLRTDRSSGRFAIVRGVAGERAGALLAEHPLYIFRLTAALTGAPSVASAGTAQAARPEAALHRQPGQPGQPGLPVAMRATRARASDATERLLALIPRGELALARALGHRQSADLPPARSSDQPLPRPGPK